MLSKNSVKNMEIKKLVINYHLIRFNNYLDHKLILEKL